MSKLPVIAILGIMILAVVMAQTFDPPFDPDLMIGTEDFGGGSSYRSESPQTTTTITLATLPPRTTTRTIPPPRATTPEIPPPRATTPAIPPPRTTTPAIPPPRATTPAIPPPTTTTQTIPPPTTTSTTQSSTTPPTIPPPTTTPTVTTPEKPSNPVKDFYKSYDSYSKADKNYQDYNNKIKSINEQLKKEGLTSSEKVELEKQLKEYQTELEKSSKERDKEYAEMAKLRDKASSTITDFGISRRMIDHSAKNLAQASNELSRYPPGTPEYQKALVDQAKFQNELQEAIKLDNEVMKRNQLCSKPWTCMGGLMRAYDKYKGIGEATAMFFPSYQKWTQDVRKTLSQTFCGFVSIQNCFESLICGAVLDISSGNAIAGNVLFGRAPNGQQLTAGTLSAERSLPIILKGLERERLKEILGDKVELVVINGNVVNISEVDTTTLPAAELRLYKIQYSLTNTNNREMKYNLEFKGQTTRKFYSSDKKLSPGQTVPSGDRNIEVYSATKYDEVCLTFNPSLPAGTGSTLIVAPKMVSKLCKPIIEYAGGATTTGNYAKKANEEKKKGAPSGGFI